MRFTSPNIGALLFKLLLFCSCFAHGQGAINIDYAKGSRWPAFATDSGAANAYAVTTVAPLGPELKTGFQIMFFATHANTGASTLAVDGGSAIAIKKNVSAALTSGDIPLNGLVIVVYDDAAPVAQTLTPDTNSYNLIFAADPIGPGNNCNCSLDDVRIYNRALTSADVTTLFAWTGATVRHRASVTQAGN